MREFSFILDLPMPSYNRGMGFKKPFRTKPIILGEYARAKKRRRVGSFAVKVLGGAGLAGAVLGSALGMHETGSLAKAGTFAGAVAKDVAVSQGIMRANTPQPGAYYRYCADARAAGVAPLRIGEPGYRPALDRDGDGVACEPYRGRR